MDRVHHGLALAEDMFQHATRANVDGMRRRVAHVDVVIVGRAMVEAAFDGLQFGLEGAAQHHVQFLEAAADADQRQAALQHLLDQLQGRGIARMVVGFVRG